MNLLQASFRLAFAAALLSALRTESLAAQSPLVAGLVEEGGISAAASTNDAGPSGIIPFTTGFNASIGTSSQHDSSSGWSSTVTPNVAYRFNRHFSMDAGGLIYAHISIDANIGTTAKPNYEYSIKRFVFGDTRVSGHADAKMPGDIDYNATVSLGLPTGDTFYGLGAGQETYTINNHFEKSVWMFEPDIEIGIGNTSSLVDPRVVKSYVSVGTIAHFQAGTSVDLPLNMSLSVDAYEELPLTKDIVYSTTGKGKKQVTTSTNEGPVEDNGFLTSLDIPLAPHVTLSGFYSRSLRQHDDVAGFSFTFLLKTPPPPSEIPH